MPSPLPLASSYVPPNKNNRFRLLRFGETPPLLQERLSSYSKALEGEKDYDNYKKTLGKSFECLPTTAQTLFKDTFGLEEKNPYLTAQDVQHLNKAKRFHILEESSDTILEIMAVKAIREGLITKELVNQFKGRLPADRTISEAERLRTINTMLDDMWQAMPHKKKRDNFIKNLPVEPQYAKRLLQMLLLKYSIRFSQDPKKFNMWQHTKKLAIGEAKELDEELPCWSPYRLLVVPMAYIYTYTSNLPILRKLPIAPYFKLLTHIDNQVLNIKVKLNELFGLVTAKQALRQVFDWFNPTGYADNKARKAVFKGWELLCEALCIKDARLWKPIKAPNILDTPVQ